VILEIGVGKVPLSVTVVGPLATQFAGVTEFTTALCTGAGGATTTVGAHTLFVIVLESSVTVPVRATSEPLIVAPVVAVIDDKATMCPAKFELVPSVAEDPTCQKTLQACAPLVRITLLPLAVVKESGKVKTNTEFGSPAPLSVSEPERLANVPRA